MRDGIYLKSNGSVSGMNRKNVLLNPSDVISFVSRAVHYPRQGILLKCSLTFNSLIHFGLHIFYLLEIKILGFCISRFPKLLRSLEGTLDQFLDKVVAEEGDVNTDGR